MGSLRGFMVLIVMVMVLPMVFFVLQPNMDVTTAQCHAIGGPASTIADKNEQSIPFIYIAMMILGFFSMLLSALGIENASTYRRN